VPEILMEFLDFFLLLIFTGVYYAGCRLLPAVDA
jgi:cbb3-type cytochrome oxidase subunit 3